MVRSLALDCKQNFGRGRAILHLILTHEIIIYEITK